MACKYSGYTWFILIGMIITGSARSIVVKLAYQSGFNAPLTITLLYLLGQSFSLIVYGVQKWFAKNDYTAPSLTKEGLASPQHPKSVELDTYAVFIDEDIIKPHVEQSSNGANSPAKPYGSPTHSGFTSPLSSPSSPSSISSITSLMSCAVFEFYDSARALTYDDDMSIGSTHGLTRQSEERIQWVHRIPFYAKPAIPAILNLLNSALRWASLMYIDASVAEMMISGLELTLGVVAARIFRKRMVAKSRWMGVIIVAVGVIIIERANNSKHQKSESDDEDGEGDPQRSRDAMIGVTLIVLQSILSALQDIGEEIFLQATDFPATMMLGMEGLYGFCIGLIIYSTVGDQLRIEDIDATMAMLSDNAKLRWWLVGLPFLFLLTGIFNIKATEVTSAMTRNVWKNFRTVLVWAIALACFYLGSNSAYGEAWHTPESFIILSGFMVMGCGIIVYYWFKEQEKSEALLAKKTSKRPAVVIV